MKKKVLAALMCAAMTVGMLAGCGGNSTAGNTSADAGEAASGTDAYLLHVTTTPSVAYVARTEDFDCGIMISASHNPFYDNGIKLINSAGEKMKEDVISEIEKYLDDEMGEIPYATREKIGCLLRNT